MLSRPQNLVANLQFIYKKVVIVVAAVSKVLFMGLILNSYSAVWEGKYKGGSGPKFLEGESEDKFTMSQYGHDDYWPSNAMVNLWNFHPTLVQAIINQTLNIQHSNVLYLNHALAGFAEALASKMPGDLMVSFLSDLTHFSQPAKILTIPQPHTPHGLKATLAIPKKLIGQNISRVKIRQIEQQARLMAMICFGLYLTQQAQGLSSLCKETQ
ncbi:hypothetical protein Tco_0149635 [Tanacetum coccineum]